MKRVIIASIFLTVNGVVFGGGYWLFFWVAPTCFDGKQNQNERGIDCGGSCVNACFVMPVGVSIETSNIIFVAGGTNLYDVVATIKNPNEALRATELRYVFELKDRSGTVLTTRSGKSTLLPRGERKLIELNLETTGVPVVATLSVTDIAWEYSQDFQEQPKVSIYRKGYTEATEGFGYGKAYGLLSNESPYDFRAITVYVTLYDRAGKVLALNKTQQNTVEAGESRDFELVWTTAFVGTVDRVDMEIDADTYDPGNFFRQDYPAGRY